MKKEPGLSPEMNENDAKKYVSDIVKIGKNSIWYIKRYKRN